MRGLTRSLFSGGIGLARQRKDRWTRSPWIILRRSAWSRWRSWAELYGSWLRAVPAPRQPFRPDATRAARKFQAKLTVKMSPSTSEPARPAKFPASKSSAGAAEATKAGRPKDVADWRLDDYHSAKRDGDPQLVAAIGYLGGHFSGKESAATLLAALLEPAADDPFAETAAAPPSKVAVGMHGSASPSYNKQTPKLTEAIIAALAANGTPRARQILQDLADGSLKVADGPAAATAAFHALAARPGREGQDFLFRMVTAAVRPAAEDPRVNDLAKLRNAAIALAGASGSESLWARLAKFMLAPETPKTLYGQLWAYVKEPRPENLVPQAVLYEGDRPDQATRSWLEQRLIAVSSGVMGRLLGLPAPQASSARPVSVVGGPLMDIPTLAPRRGAAADRSGDRSLSSGRAAVEPRSGGRGPGAGCGSWKRWTTVRHRSRLPPRCPSHRCVSHCYERWRETGMRAPRG